MTGDLRFDNGTFDLGSAMAGCHGAVVLSDGTRLTTREPGSGLSWHVEPDAATGGLLLWLEFTNSKPYPLTVERLDVLVVPSGFTAAPMETLRLQQTGYQSWSYATPGVPWAEQPATAPPPVSGYMLPPTEAERFVSSWMAMLTTAEGRNLLAGFITAENQASTIAVQPALEGHRLTASAHAESTRVWPGDTLRSETLLLLIDAPEPLETYAKAAARAMGAQPAQDVTTGWCSWYYFFTEVSEADMLANLEVLEANRERLPLAVVQLDDGYQTAIGDWLSLNAKFPSGMRALTDAIHAKGYQAGLWLAPFMVGENSEVYREHPDWVLRDAAGEPIDALTNWGTRNFGLDLTHPGVEAYLSKVFKTICDDWNFDYLKIDFIYAGALVARRDDPDVTSVQAYRRGLALIREIAGERFVLGCGAPFLPSVGLVDGMRVGPDTAPHWSDPDPRGTAPALLNAIRSTLAHHWMHPHWFVNDPDCLIVRSTDTQLTPAEVQTWASVVALSGGMVLLSDDMTRLDSDRAAILPRALPPSGKAAVPRGTGARHGVPEAMALPLPTFEVVALFNWDEAPRPLTFEGPENPYHLVDLWSGEHWGPLTGPFTLPPTPPHGVRLLAVHPDRGRPQLVGSLLHLLGGAVEVESETWDGETLTITLAAPGLHEGDLIVYDPAAGALRVPVTMREKARIDLRFSKETRDRTNVNRV